MPKSRGRTKAEKKRGKNRRRELRRARGERAEQLATPGDLAQLDPAELEAAVRRGMLRGRS